MPSITITDLQNAKLDVDHIAEIVTSPDATATDRLGVVKNTLAGSLAIMASFNERGAWVSGTSYAIKDIYIFESIAYVVTLSHTSSTVSADLAAGRVAIHQGATKEELSSLSNGLAASSGAALVGFLQSGTGTVARTLQSKERDAVSLYDFAGADPTGGTDSYAAFASAITYLASINGGKLILPPGTFKLMTPIVISSSNIVIEGSGGDGIHDGGSGATPATILRWGGASNTTSVITFLTPSSASNSKRNSIGLSKVAIDCNGLISGGLTLQSVSGGTFNNICVYNPTYAAYLIKNYVAGSLADVSDSQQHVFTNCMFRCIDLAASAGACGFILTSDIPRASGANTSFNVFNLCFGQIKNGTAYLIQDGDNNLFYSCRAAIVGTGKSLEIYGCDCNHFFDFSSSGPIRIYGIASGMALNPVANSFYIADTGNGTTYPTMDTGCRVAWVTDSGVEIKARMTNVAFAQDVGSALTESDLVTNETLRIRNGSNNHVVLTDGATRWGINTDGSGSFRIIRISGTGILELGGVGVDFRLLGSRNTSGGTAPTTGTWVRSDRCVNWLPAVGSPKAWTCTLGGTPGTWVSEGNL
jgi:hypothetical protein